MKQKITIKVHARCDKCRTDALKIAAEEYGVNSVALDGAEKVVVIGERVDAANLTQRLYKKIGYAWLERVEEVKPPAPGPAPAQTPPPPPPPPSCCNCRRNPGGPFFGVIHDSPPSNNCIIM